MEKKAKISKVHLYPLIISIVLFLISSLIYTHLGILDGLEVSAIDYRFYFRAPEESAKPIQTVEGKAVRYQPNPKARKDILILGIEGDTITSFSNKDIFWPFPWDIHAKFTKYVGTGDPLAIFFDIMFLDNKEHKEEFAESIKDAKNVFLDYPFEKQEGKEFTDKGERLEILNQLRFPADPDDNSKMWVKDVVPPIPILAKAARGIGFANVETDPDNIVRQIPMIMKFDGYYYPCIDLVIAMRYYGIDKKDVEIKMGKYIKLKNVPLEKMAKPNAEREVIIPIDSNGFMDINYIGGHDSFANYPYYLFYRDGELGNKSLKDKIILVAAYTVSGIASDVQKSPYGTTFGIEHHANTINTILNQDFLYKFTTWQNILILLAIALIMGLLLTRLSIISSVIFTIVFAFLYIVGAITIFETNNIVCIFATPLFQILFTFMFIVAYRVLSEQKEKRQIRSTFSKLVAKSVVDELLKNPDDLKLGGEKKILTVFFSDIRGFTTLSEKLTPEALVEHLNEYLEAMTNIVMKYEGTLDKYVGDEIMAFWGAPIPQEDHAIRACKASIEMIDTLNKMNERWLNLPEPKPPLNIGIGLNTGDMVVALMGSSSRMDYTLMGDNVNLGARLEGTNKVYSTQIIISEYTYEQVKDRIIARELDLIRVKGKEQPVKIYELIDVKG